MNGLNLTHRKRPRDDPSEFGGGRIHTVLRINFNNEKSFAFHCGRPPPAATENFDRNRREIHRTRLKVREQFEGGLRVELEVRQALVAEAFPRASLAIRSASRLPFVKRTTDLGRMASSIRSPPALAHSREKAAGDICSTGTLGLRKALP